MKMAYRSGLLSFMNFRYLKLSGLLMAASIGAYVFAPLGSEPYGGTWLGYLLGIVSALIVLLLLWYGIAKRRRPRVHHREMSPAKERRRQGSVRLNSFLRRWEDRGRPRPGDPWSRGGTLQGWLSLHINLGGSLIVLATLHTGFQFGWNVHTLSYVLMLLVIASGFYGLYAYLKYPRLITLNQGEETLEDLLLQIDELDELARVQALALPDEVNALVQKSRQGTRLGGSLLQQLSGRQRGCPTTAAARQMLKLGPKYIKHEQPKLLRELYGVLLRKESLVLRARREIMLKARMQFWLYLHVPLTVALLAALVAHVVAILYYW
ncbi:MAG TPA: hypothetical protein VFW59_10930 [Gallionella sp.]|nr:hypothetical protein [Gallionella sp.]